jgi:signal transduction histidine kinase
LPAPVELALYRIAQEALNNALKHARAGQVTVRLGVDDGRLTLEVEDDGQGFDPQSASDGGGMGLANIRHRTEQLGGALEVRSAPGKGTVVRVSLEGEL